MSEITAGGMVSVKHQWPKAPNYEYGQEGFYNQDTFLTINSAPVNSYYFWAQQFWFINGNGGYMGLQTGGNLNGHETKIAIFSIWDALDAVAGQAKNSYAGPFGGEGVGYSCKIEYDWQDNVEYRVRLWELSDARKPEEPEWWGAWIMDMSTQEETFIGKILVPANWKWLNSSGNFFVEYFLPTNGCENVPYAKATLSVPRRENGTVQPISAPIAEEYGVCKSVAKTTVKDGIVIAETGVQSS